jgi:small subunit ribosomal protein S2
MTEEKIPNLNDLEALSDLYTKSALIIGTRFKSKYMRRFISKTRPEGVNIINYQSIDERVRIAGKFLSYFEGEKILVVASRPYAIKPATKFSEYIGAQCITTRFLPGTLTNPMLQSYKRVEVLFVNDPLNDAQAVKEASEIGIPIVALCDTEHTCANVDLVIPCNNKGRKALATIYWLLTVYVLRNRGALGINEMPKFTIDEFETELVEELE